MCVSTAFAAKTLPLPCGSQVLRSGRDCMDEAAPCVLRGGISGVPVHEEHKDGPTCQTGIAWWGPLCSITLLSPSVPLSVPPLFKRITAVHASRGTAGSNTSEWPSHFRPHTLCPRAALAPEHRRSVVRRKESGASGRAVCCPASCGQCGAPECSSKPGGAENCCTGPVFKSGRDCADYPPPCR